MSIKDFSDCEIKALEGHGLKFDTPSQLSDAFVLGLRYQNQLKGQNDKLRELLEYFYKLPVDFDKVWASEHLMNQAEAYNLLQGENYES